MDVLWFRLSRKPTDPDDSDGLLRPGPHPRHDQPRRLLAVRPRHPEGRRRRDPRAAASRPFATALAAIAPFARDRVGELRNWDDVKLLTVRVDRLERWYRPGLLCIGDAAHAMSPIGGVGINLAIQDAVGAANLLAAPLGAGRVTTDDLGACRAAASLAHPRHPVDSSRRSAAHRRPDPRRRGPVPPAAGRSGCSNAFPCSAASPPASSAWASAPSTSTRRTQARVEGRCVAASSSKSRVDGHVYGAAMASASRRASLDGGEAQTRVGPSRRERPARGIATQSGRLSSSYVSS